MIYLPVFMVNHKQKEKLKHASLQSHGGHLLRENSKPKKLMSSKSAFREDSGCTLRNGSLVRGEGLLQHQGQHLGDLVGILPPVLTKAPDAGWLNRREQLFAWQKEVGSLSSQFLTQQKFTVNYLPS